MGRTAKRRHHLLAATGLLSVAVGLPVAAEPPGAALLAEYFRRETEAVADACLAGIDSREQWEAGRDEMRRRFAEMLGLEPLPPRTPLEPVVTGTVQHDAFRVENLHFQSLPGLYVTGNLYLPRGASAPAPTILYACGHAPERGAGVSYGNKTHYRHHGEYLARNGYVCLAIDTLQLGEIEGEHHGLYKLGRWWWASRGYTPAGIEAWNCIRAIDYLQSRPEVDDDRIGMTGRSGGGASTWWTAALDERIRAVVPVAGLTDLRDHVIDGCVDGHCDCMFMVNTYRWDYPQVAALVAPRPLLIGNTDSDPIFPLDGVVRTFEKMRHIYRLHGAEQHVGLVIAPGPHRDLPELQVAALRWFDAHLRREERPIETAAVTTLTRERLRVFAALPEDQVNTRIDETFVAAAAAADPGDAVAWPRQRDAWLAALRDTTFRGWPTVAEPLDVEPAWAAEHDGVTAAAYDFTSQSPFRLRLHVARRAGLEKPSRTVLTVLDEAGWTRFLGNFAGPFAAELGTAPADRGADDWSRIRAGLATSDVVLAFVAPRGVGPTAWGADEQRQTRIRRRFCLLGQTLEGMQVYDVRRAVQALRALAPFDATPLWLEGRGTLAGIAVYAALFEPGVERLDLHEPPRSHRDGPVLLGVQRILDMPQAVALAAERGAVVLHEADDGTTAWAYPRAVAAALGWGGDRVRIESR